jgi:endonuclease/exonuclease/phosphatase family metal-dependent hydrolase
MAKAVVKMIKGKKKVVLGGDTNARPTNQAIRDIEQHVVNVFGHELANTFNMRRKDNPGYATSVVDMLFVTPNIRVLSKQRHDVDVSDHVPISAVLEI